MDASTSTATDTGALTLRAWPQGDTGAKHSISQLIERVNAQEGSFRSITEESLEETIRRLGPDATPQETTEVREDDGEPDDKSRRAVVLKAKGEIFTLAEQAWTESSHTLDLISLVVSQFNRKTAEYTMSPFIKQTLPGGCLGTEELEGAAAKESIQAANELTSFGWKLESLAASADSILRSATSLEQEMEKEARYWEDILAVKKQGWSICSLPRERHTLGVRYGFLESGPEFRDRGLAAIRRGDDGAGELDLGAAYLTPRPLRVQVKARGEIVAATSASLQEPETLEGAILQARNDLFDEELYHEMSREARTLTNRNVKCVGDSIVIPVDSDVSLIVSLFDEDAALPLQQPQLNSTEYQELPELAATAFRLLLSHSHRQAYIKRTELPPPLKKRKQQRQVPAIIQPILSHLEHRTYLRKLSSHLQTLNAVLTKAGVPFVVSPIDSSLHLSRLLSADKGTDNFAHTLVAQLCSTLRSSLRIRFGAAETDTSVKITVHTHASGSEFRALKTNSATGSALGQTPDTMHFSELAVLHEYLSHLVVLHLVDLAAAQAGGRWRATDPDAGELTTEPTLDGVVEMLTVRLEAGELELSWRSSHAAQTAEESTRWRTGGVASAEAGGEKSFVDEVSRMSSLRAIAMEAAAM